MKYEKKLTIDAIDRKILRHLQQNASMTLKAISEQVNLSPTPCWKRIRRMEENGIIRARVALLDPTKVGASVTVFVSVRTMHNAEWSKNFLREMKTIPEIVEIYRMTGEVDYLLRVVVADIAAYDRIYKTITGRVALADVTSMFALEQVKHTTALPV